MFATMMRSIGKRDRRPRLPSHQELSPPSMTKSSSRGFCLGVDLVIHGVFRVAEHWQGEHGIMRDYV